MQGPADKGVTRGMALVTGATGFIGEHLVRMLLDSNYKVRVYSRQQISDRSRPPIEKEEWLTGELLDAAKLRSACTSVDVVYHLAGIAHTDLANKNQLFDANLAATRCVFSAAAEAGVKRFIFFSSILASDPRTSLYAESKYLAEKYLHSCSKQYADIKITILRPANVYGPGMKGNLARLISYLARDALLSLPKLDNVTPLISVGDLCKISVAVSEVDVGESRVLTYTILDGQRYTVNRIERAVYAAKGVSKPALRLPRFILFSAALFLELANRIGVGKSGIGLQLYGRLVHYRNLSYFNDLPGYNVSATETLELQMPQILSFIERQ